MTAAESASPAHVGASDVAIVDVPQQRVHRVADLLQLTVTVTAIAAVLLAGAYAEATTAGITADVREISTLLGRLLVVPVNVIEGIVTLGVPAIITATLAIRREPRRIIETLAAMAVGIGVALLAVQMTSAWGSPALVDSLSIERDGDLLLQLPVFLAGLSAMITAAGRRESSRAFGASWNFVFVAVALAAIAGQVTLPAVLATVLIGRAVGLVMRYLLGTASDRAYGEALVRAIRRAGFDPASIVRVDPLPSLDTTDTSARSAALARTRSGRVYEIVTAEGHELFIVAMDGDRLVAGTLAKGWRTLRLRGVSLRADVSLRHSAESTSLVSHAARTAGVRTARVLGMAQERDTMVIVYQRLPEVTPFAMLTASDVEDDALDAVWSEIAKAHAAGISHRQITSDTVMVGRDAYDPTPVVWLTSWEMGEVASSALSRRMDNVQVLAMFAAKVGARRAVDSAFRSLPEAEIEALAPLLQSIMLPRSTRIETRARGPVLADVRDEILERLPEAPTAPQNLTRFGLRTVVSLALAVVALWIVLTTFNAQDVLSAVRMASPWWIVAIIAWTSLTYVGSSLAMLAFSPVRLPIGKVFLAQMAAAYVALAAPAGVGPAAINLRLLLHRNVHRGLAVATVALVQVSSIVITIVGLFGLSLITGTDGALASLPSGTVLLLVGLTAVLLAAALAFPKVRNWALQKIMPTVRQTWPRLVQIVGQPWRLALGLAGNLLQTIAFIGALDAALRALGQDLAVVDVAVLFLLGNAAGALVPTPGGIGTVEIALTTGMTAAGVGTAIAGSAAVLFRAVTYWGRIPLGYVAMRYLQREGEL